MSAYAFWLFSAGWLELINNRLCVLYLMTENRTATTNNQSVIQQALLQSVAKAHNVRL